MSDEKVTVIEELPNGRVRYTNILRAEAEMREAEKLRKAEIARKRTYFLREYFSLCEKWGVGLNTCSCCGLWVSDMYENDEVEIR